MGLFLNVNAGGGQLCLHVFYCFTSKCFKFPHLFFQQTPGEEQSPIEAHPPAACSPTVDLSSPIIVNGDDILKHMRPLETPGLSPAHVFHDQPPVVDVLEPMHQTHEPIAAKADDAINRGGAQVKYSPILFKLNL